MRAGQHRAMRRRGRPIYHTSVLDANREGRNNKMEAESFIILGPSLAWQTVVFLFCFTFVREATAAPLLTLTV